MPHSEGAFEQECTGAQSSQGSDKLDGGGTCERLTHFSDSVIGLRSNDPVVMQITRNILEHWRK